MAEHTVLVADDHPLFREALKLAVARASPGASILEAANLHDALEQARAAARLDLVLLDLRMPGAEGFSGLALLHAERPDTPVIVVSAADPGEAAPRARCYGAAGFLPKSADLPTIERSVRAALAGAAELPGATAGDGAVDAMAGRIATLTPAQLKVLIGVLAGRLNKQIAYDLQISEATVKAHMTAVFRKLGVMNRTQAVLAAKALDLEAEPGWNEVGLAAG